MPPAVMVASDTTRFFLAEGQERTNAELTPEEKNAFSHRGKAFRALAPAIAATIELGGNITPAQARA